MTAPTANGHGLLHARLTLPLRGVWYADVQVEAEEADLGDLLEDVTLDFGAIRFVGRTRRGGHYHGRVELEVAGGGGGMETVLEPRYYTDATAGLILRDLAREAGETLATDLDAAVSGAALARWTRARGRAGDAVAELGRALAKAWRIRPDGSLWMGDEAWPDAELEHEVLVDEPARERQSLGVDAPTLLPGTLLGGRRVSHVVHVIAPGAYRTEVWYDPGETTNPEDVVLAPFFEAYSGAWRRQDRTALYSARVVAQAADGSVEVRFDDARWPSLTKVRLRTFVPGATIEVTAGARVLVGWEEARPDRPYALAWESGSMTRLAFDSDEIDFGHSGVGAARLEMDAAEIRAGGGVALAEHPSLDAHLSAIAADFTTLSGVIAGLGGAFTPTYGMPQKAVLDATNRIPTDVVKGT